MRMYDIIKSKRDGNILTSSEIKYAIDEYTKGNIPEYQMSALLMAIYLKGMTPKEVSLLTDAMACSGDKIKYKDYLVVDKHSTGGVGDKTSLISIPIASACGVVIAKMSGRGLGHTGGTIDKLESIPGFRTTLDKQELEQNIQKIGIAIIGQSNNLVPADKRIYALRDVTATVDSIPLIASSIMSKKIASGAKALVLDVKVGHGAFMSNIDNAIELAQMMVRIGEHTWIETVAYITDMDSPLGNYIGNSLEVIEAIETLKGNGPDDLKELCIELSARMLTLSKNISIEEAKLKANEAITNGSALVKFTEMIKYQGGDIGVINDYSLLNVSKKSIEVKAEKSGYVSEIMSDDIAEALNYLGGGREKKDDEIDRSVGVTLFVKPGVNVIKGRVLASLNISDNSNKKEAIECVKKAFIIKEYQAESKPLIRALIDSNGLHQY